MGRAGRRGAGRRPEDNKVLTLRKLLETVADAGRRVELAIETKHPTRYGGLVERRLVELLTDFGWTGEDSPARVMSFSFTALQRVERMAPQIKKVMLVEKAHHWPMLRRAVGKDWIIGPGISELRDHPGLGKHLRLADREIHVWTVNTEEELKICLDLGVTAVISDKPAYMLELLGAPEDPTVRRTAFAPWPRSPAPKPVTLLPSRGRSARASPVPCGSGKRYKACHGAAGGAAPAYVARPFEGLPGECDMIALRELVPAATVPLTVPSTDREVRLCTLLPMAAPAMVRDSGAIWLGLQVAHQYGDPARDLGAVLEAAIATEEAGIVGLTSDPGEGPRLQDLITNESLDITVHDGFGYWIDDIEDQDDSMAGRARAGQRLGQPDRSTQQRRGGVLDQRRTQGTPALGDAAPGGRAPQRPRAAALRGPGLDRRRLALRGHVPRARPAGSGLGPARRHRCRGAGEAGREVRLRAGRRARPGRRPERRGALRSRRSGQPPGHHSMTR